MLTATIATRSHRLFSLPDLNFSLIFELYYTTFLSSQEPSLETFAHKDRME